MAKKKTDVVQADAETVGTLSAATLVGDVRDQLLNRLRFDHNPLPWDTRKEAEQQETVQEITEFATALVDKAVKIVAGEGRRMVIVNLDAVDFKAKTIMVKGHVTKEEANRHALADAVGGQLLAVITSSGDFAGEQAAVPIRHDQADFIRDDLAVPFEEWTALSPADNLDGPTPADWPTDGQPLHLARFAKKDLVQWSLGFWLEEDTTAGWAKLDGRPLDFEPTHWRARDLGPGAAPAADGGAS